MHFDVAVAGAGPAGLSAAYAAASIGRSVLVVEQNNEIGSPTRTSGGSFINDLTELGIPQELLHPVHRLRFLSLHRSAEFEYPEPILCVMDVRGVYQHLAVTAAQAGATIWPASKALDVIKDGSNIVGVRVETRTKAIVDIGARVVIDATGYRGQLLRQAGLSPRFQRFGVGAEYDMYAPHCSQDEAVLVVGSEFAPSGYAWVAPWGRHRVRVGVGVIHPDHDADPADRLASFVAGASKLGVNLEGAQPIEYHFGLIPSDMGETFVGDGILATGDAAGHASTLVGEGIRWAIKAGRMAGTVAANAIERDDVSAAFLSQFQSEWLRRYGRNLRIANMLNRKISRWDDKTWDERTELLGLLSPDEFGRGLQTEFSVSWALGIAWAHPRLVKAGFDKVLGKLGIG
ncbi:MAG: NAD(P)/FAD-dependent oxidoreductase [Bryobacteraceae bacterium]|jgi:digeranylgeranylglycerophospholipid reductase